MLKAQDHIHVSFASGRSVVVESLMKKVAETVITETRKMKFSQNMSFICATAGLDVCFILTMFFG